MAPVPSIDEAFGTASANSGIPSLDEAFGAAPPGPTAKSDAAIQRSIYGILNSFSAGVKGGFGDEPITTPANALSPTTEETMKKVGVFNDYKKGQADFSKGMFEGVFRASAAALELAGRTANAAIGGIVEAGGKTLEDIGAIEPEQSKGAGAGAGTDPFVQLMLGGGMPELEALENASNARRASNLEVDFSRARAAGTIGEGDTGHFEAAPVAPENVQARVAAAVDAGQPIPETEPWKPTADVHELARRIDPETMQKFDALAAEKDQHRATINSLAAERENSPEAIDAKTRIDTILGKVNGVEDRLTNKAAERLAEAQADLDKALRSDTPEMAKSRQALLDADIAQRDLVPDVSAAYRQAHEMLPPKEPEAPLSTETERAKINAFTIADEHAAEVQQLDTEGMKAAAAPKPAQEPVTAKEAAPVEGKAAATGKGPGGPLKAVEGTGELKTRTLSEGVEAKAIEEHLISGFGDLPEYKAVTMADQAARSAEYLDKDYEGAKAVAMGQKRPPKDVLPESIFVAVEKRAIAEGDVDTLYKLATGSRLTTEATTMGQRIRTLGERDPTSPVGAIQEIQTARETGLAAKNEAAKADEIKSMKAEMKATASRTPVWEDFINSITCKE